MNDLPRWIAANREAYESISSDIFPAALAFRSIPLHSIGIKKKESSDSSCDD